MSEALHAPFEGAFDGCPEPLAILDGGALIARNAAFRQLFGEAGELSAVIHPADREALEKARGTSAKSTFVARRGNSEGEAFSWTMWPAGGGRTCLRLDGSADRSGEKIPEALAPWFSPNEKPSLATLLLGKLFERMDVIFWAADKDGKTLLSEGQGLAHYGLKPGQVVGLNVFEMFRPGMRGYEDAKKVLIEGKRVRNDYIEVTDHWIQALDPIFGPDGAVTAYVGFAMCVSENTRDTIQAKTLLEAVDLLPLAVWAMDRDGTCTLSAGQGVRDLGFEPSWLIGKNLFELYSADPESVEFIRRALGGERFVSQQTIGGGYWRNHFIPIRDAMGEKVVRVVSVTENLTEQVAIQKKLEEQLTLIQSQQQAIAMLSSPVIEVWQGVVVVPVIGNMDESRAQSTLERLLNEVVRRQSHAVILDLTGVEVVDTATAQHLFDIMRSVELLGATGVLSGIRASVARTMVELGINLASRKTYPSLAEALRRLIGSRGK